MSVQFLTDGKMFFAASLVFVLMFAIGVILIVWHDWDVVWIVAFEIIQAGFVAYYAIVFQDPASPITQFPVTSYLFRLVLIAHWALIVTYSFVRLNLKRRLKKQ